MIAAIALILGMQLLGEGAARLFNLGVPGPVIGLVLLACLLALSAGLREIVRPVASTLLVHLSLLFVPAAVGLVQHLGVFADHLWPLLIALGLSTLLTLVVTATAFIVVARMMGPGGTPNPDGQNSDG
ncbi:MAG: CidA/LrgA family protein [Pseudomonadota bacterium]